MRVCAHVCCVCRSVLQITIRISGPNPSQLFEVPCSKPVNILRFGTHKIQVERTWRERQVLFRPSTSQQQFLDDSSNYLRMMRILDFVTHPRWREGESKFIFRLRKVFDLFFLFLWSTLKPKPFKYENEETLLGSLLNTFKKFKYFLVWKNWKMLDKVQLI